MRQRLILQNLYYKIFREHLFTSLNKLPTSVSNLMIKRNYANRIWNEYPIIKDNKNNQDILFIHIPKCGGTSVANSLGINDIRHVPANIFYTSNPSRFDKSFVFCIIRNPLERLASIIMHFRSSQFASSKEKNIFKDCNISESNIGDWISALLTNNSFRNKLFSNSEPGRSGFSVNQIDYIASKENIRVKNLFLLDTMDIIINILSNKLDKELPTYHNNKSNRKNYNFITEELEDVARKLLPNDYFIYDSLVESGGYILEDTKEINKLQKAYKKIN